MRMYCIEQSKQEKVRPQFAKLPPRRGDSLRRACRQAGTQVSSQAGQPPVQPAAAGCCCCRGQPVIQVKGSAESAGQGSTECSTEQPAHLHSAGEPEPGWRVLHALDEVPHAPAHRPHGKGPADIINYSVWARLSLVLHDRLLLWGAGSSHCRCTAKGR